MWYKKISKYGPKERVKYVLIDDKFVCPGVLDDDVNVTMYAQKNGRDLRRSSDHPRWAE